jgi:hypothetical protein
MTLFLALYFIYAAYQPVIQYGVPVFPTQEGSSPIEEKFSFHSAKFSQLLKGSYRDDSVFGTLFLLSSLPA